MDLKIVSILCVIIIGVLLAGCTSTGDVTGAATEVLEGEPVDDIADEAVGDALVPESDVDQIVDETGEMQITDIWRPLSFKVGETDTIKVIMTKINDVPDYEYTVTLSIKEGTEWREIETKRSTYMAAAEETFDWTPAADGDFELRVTVDGDEEIIPIEVVPEGRRKKGEVVITLNDAFLPPAFSNLKWVEVKGVEAGEFRNIYGQYTYMIESFSGEKIYEKKEFQCPTRFVLSEYTIKISGPGINEKKTLNGTARVIRWSTGQVDFIAGYSFFTPDCKKVDLSLFLYWETRTLKVGDHVTTDWNIDVKLADIITNGEQKLAEMVITKDRQTQKLVLGGDEDGEALDGALRIYVKSISNS